MLARAVGCKQWHLPTEASSGQTLSRNTAIAVDYNWSSWELLVSGVTLNNNCERCPLRAHLVLYAARAEPAGQRLMRERRHEAAHVPAVVAAVTQQHVLGAGLHAEPAATGESHARW